MVINNRLDIGTSQYWDAEDIQVKNSMGEYNSASTFSAGFGNINGKHKGDFTVGDEILVFADKDQNPVPLKFTYTFPLSFAQATKLFLGVLEGIKFTGKGQSEKITITGRDYTAKLQDVNVEPTVYNDDEVSVIVIDLMTTYAPEISTANVDTTTVTINHIAFNHLSVYDALKELAKKCGFTFWIDADKVLNFKAKGTVSSGIILDNSNILSSTFNESDQDMANDVWVYGDRILTKTQNNFTANGGSVYTLTYQPHNTEVLVGGGSVPYKGGIYELVSFAFTGTQYLLDFDNKNIIFVSGTDAGNNIPTSGTDDIIVNYDRSTPIIKRGTDRASTTLYGTKSKVIVDKNIKDPNMAVDILKGELISDNTLPKKQGNIKIRGVINLTAGNTVAVNLPKNDIINQNYDILQASYSFNAKNNYSENVLDVKVNKKIRDVSDTIKQIILDLKKIQTQDILTSDIIARLEQASETVGPRIKSWQIYTRNMGNSFQLGATLNGVLGSPAPSVIGTNNVLGDYRAGSVFQISGGEV